MNNVTLSERPSIINPEPTVNVAVQGAVRTWLEGEYEMTTTVTKPMLRRF